MKRILLVEDDELLRAYLKQKLEREGYFVSEAPDGLDAMKLLKDSEFDLLLSDIIMPDKDGVETIADVKRLRPNIRIIAMSGGDKATHAWQKLIDAKKVGADYILIKPFSGEKLLETIQHCFK